MEEAYSEFETQSCLNLPGRIDHAVAAAAGDPEELIAREPINASEDMAVKGVRDIQLEENIFAFCNASSFEYGKVLVLIDRTSPPGNDAGKVAEGVALSSALGIRAGVFECRAIGWPHG